MSVPIFIKNCPVELEQGCVIYMQITQLHKTSKRWDRLSKEECHHLYGFIEHFFAKGLHRRLEQHNNLTKGDVFVCYFSCLYIEPKELAEIMRLSSEALKKQKQRLKKKLGISTNLPLHIYLKDAKNRYCP